MSEADLVERLSDFLANYLAGVSLSFTVVSAYIVALFYFLNRAPWSMRFLAFLLVSVILASLGMFVLVVFQYFLALREGLTALDDIGQLSSTGAAMRDIMEYRTTHAIIITIFVIGVGVYIGLFYLTFLHRWPPRPAATPVHLEPQRSMTAAQDLRLKVHRKTKLGAAR